VELREISRDDLPLWERLNGDPVMMAELGGPQPKARIAHILDYQISFVASGRGWAYKVIADDGQPAGSINLWESEHAGEPISEIGWMILPEYQGQGLATRAVTAVFNLARATGRWQVIHAFTGVTNAPSNSLCRRLGFAHLDVCDVSFGDRLLHCNHWRIDLLPGTAADAPALP
jgi:RimJ/RimL family protein N-acetyltransferase